jgi:hypothetical protein
MIHDKNELQVPPGNRLERIKGERQNQYSIRINQQYRICFTWEEGNVYTRSLPGRFLPSPHLQTPFFITDRRAVFVAELQVRDAFRNWKIL